MANSMTGSIKICILSTKIDQFLFFTGSVNGRGKPITQLISKQGPVLQGRDWSSDHCSFLRNNTEPLSNVFIKQVE